MRFFTLSHTQSHCPARASDCDLLTETLRVCVCVLVCECVYVVILQDVLTVKLLLTFFVLDSATLASDRSTSSKIRDCRKMEVWGERKEGSPRRSTER